MTSKHCNVLNRMKCNEKGAPFPLFDSFAQQIMELPSLNPPNLYSSDERNEVMYLERRKEGENDLGPYLQFRGWNMRVGVFPQIMAVC